MKPKTNSHMASAKNQALANNPRSIWVPVSAANTRSSSPGMLRRRRPEIGARGNRPSPNKSRHSAKEPPQPKNAR